MTPTLGEIRMFAGNFAPRSWAFCNGQLMAISQNQALFSILGTTYGGDGRTTFALPDLRGRVPISPGQGAGLTDFRLGQRSGRNDVTFTVQNLPPHSHTFNVSNAAGTSSTPVGNVPANSQVQIERGGTEHPVNSSGTNANATMGPSAIANNGGNQPVSIMNPFLGLHYIIALQGIFPSRN